MPVNIRISQDFIEAMDEVTDYVASMDEMQFVSKVKRADVHRMALILGLRELQKRRTKLEKETRDPLEGQRK